MINGRWCVLMAAVLWSTGGVISKSLELDSLTIAFYRGLFAGLALLPFVPRPRWAFRPVLIPLGVVFGAMVAFFLGAVKTTTSANAIFLQCTSTFWVVPLSAILLHERPDRRARVSIALAMVGILAIVGWGYDGRPHEWQGIVLGLASGITYACIAVSLRGLRELDPIWLSTVLNLLGIRGAGILGLGQWSGVANAEHDANLGADRIRRVPDGDSLYVVRPRSARDRAPEAGLIGLVEPILNPIWVVLIVHEWPAGPTIIGGLFLLGGLVYRYWPLRMTLDRRVPTLNANFRGPENN